MWDGLTGLGGFIPGDTLFLSGRKRGEVRQALIDINGRVRLAKDAGANVLLVLYFLDMAMPRGCI